MIKTFIQKAIFSWVYVLCVFFSMNLKGAESPQEVIRLQPELFEMANGPCMMFWLRGANGRKYRIESSPENFANSPWAQWTPIDSTLRSDGPVLCVDVATYVLNRQQYRAILVDDEISFSGSLPPETEMIWIEPGAFVMGSTEQDSDNDEQPLTVVRLTKRYALGVHEVTQRQFVPVMGYNPSRFKFDDSHPVTNARWKDAVEYCRRLTILEREAGLLGEDYRYRLPTEAEWEYACRAGSRTRFHYGDDPDYELLGAYAWYGENSGVSTQPVMTRLPNAWGLHGMHGNVHEWCLDQYDLLPGGYVEDPINTKAGDLHVIRGGSWLEFARNCRSSDRHRNWFVNYIGNVGFRIALVAED